VAITQHITATVSLVGAEPVLLDAHGTGGPGSLITVTIGTVAVWLHDRRAADCYCEAWLDGVVAEAGLYLPAARHFDVGQRAAAYPVLAVHADGWDRHAATYNPTRRELVVTVGYVTWVVCDHVAYDAQVDAWRRVRDLARLILPD
jgi:hypothetical protein